MGHTARTELTNLNIDDENSGVDDPANGVPGWLVMKSRGGKRQQVREILEKAHADAGVETNPDDADEFYDAFTRMVRAFEEAEGRKPKENDTNFLTAAIALYERFFNDDAKEQGDRVPIKKASGASRQALGGRRIVMGATALLKAKEPLHAGPPSNRRLVLTGKGVVNARDHLAKLDAEVEAAQARYSAALDAVRKSSHTSSAVDVLTRLYDYHHGVEVKQGVADSAELRRLTADACERIVDEGLVFFVPTPGQLRIVDPSYEDEVKAAKNALNVARNGRDHFANETRQQREDQFNRETTDKLRAALDGDDPDELRQALNTAAAFSGDGGGRAALSTADLEAGEPTPRPATGRVFRVGG
jgi:hypothetical protein